MERFDVLLLLLFTTSENVEPTGAVTPAVVSVNVYIVMVVDVNDCDALAMAPSEELLSVTVTVRLVLPVLPLRASSRFTVKLPGFSVSAVCSAGFSVKVCDWLLPLMVSAACVPVGCVRDSRCELLQR